MSLPPYQNSDSRWRELSTDRRLEYMNWMVSLITRRQIEGRSKYGDTFVGDPLEHLAEELMDGLFYTFQAMRQRATLFDKETDK